MPVYKISKLSASSLKSELDVFSVPPTQTSVENTFPVELLLSNALTSTGPYEFHIPPDNFMLDVYHNELYVRAKIVDNAGADLAPTGAGVHPEVGPINLLAKTLISQIKLSINGKLVEDSGDKYAYRALFETDLNYGSDAKDSHLQAAGYAADSHGHMNDAQNTGFTQRQLGYRTSSEVELVGKIHCDLFNQEKCLPSNMDLRLELHRNSDNFCLLCYTANAPQYRLVVTDMRWKVWKVEPSKDFALALERLVLTTPMRYPIRRVQISTLYVAAGSRSAPNNTLFSGQLPRRIILAMVNSNAYHGSQAENPFNFQHFNINHISLHVSGRTIPSYDVPIDIANGRFLRHYCDLMSVLDMSNTSKGNTLSLERYKSGSTYFGFDLSPDHDPDGGHWDLQQEGTISLNITFSAAVVAPGIVIVVYKETENMIEFDPRRNVTHDFAA